MLIAEWIKEWEKRVPAELQEDWDNTGKQFGDFDKDLKGIVFSLDLTEDAIDLALEKGANLIFAHHPVFYSPIKSLLTDDPLSAMIIRSIREGICLYSSHTAFDAVNGGVNDHIAEIIGLRQTEALDPMPEDNPLSAFSKGMGRIGLVPDPSLTVRQFGEILNKKFGGHGVFIYGKPDAKVSKVAVLGGGGMSFVDRALKGGADLYVTADIKYHEAQAAIRKGLNLIDLGHFASEEPAMDRAKEWGEKICPEVPCYISKDSWDCIRRGI